MTVRTEAVLVVKCRKYELVPPDGGWGYMIWIAAIIIYSSTSMFLGCFGLIYKDFLEQLGMGSTSVTFMNGMNIMIMSIAGYFTNALLKLMGLRNLSLMAAFLFSAGNFCTTFVNSVVPFFICLGPLQSTGFGILFNLATSQINDYFLKKRFMSVSLVQTVASLATIISPYIISWSLDYYGFRGTLIVTSAISMQTFVAAALMQPVTKHLVKIEKTVKAEPIADGDTEELLLVEESKPQEKVTTPVITLSDPESSFEVRIHDNEGTGYTAFKKVLEKIFDIPLINKYRKSVAAMGSTYCFFVQGLFILWIPQALYAMEWSKEDVAQGISLSSFGNLVTRIFFTFSSKWLIKLGCQEIFITGLLITTLSILGYNVSVEIVSLIIILMKLPALVRILMSPEKTTGMLWSNRIIVVLVFLTMTGIARCTIAILPPLILGDLFEPEQFTAVIGIYMITIGITNLIIGPAYRAIRDLTNSYPTVFYMIASSYAIVIILWCTELLYKRSKEKRLLRKEQAEMLQKQRLKQKGKNHGLKNNF